MAFAIPCVSNYSIGGQTSSSKSSSGGYELWRVKKHTKHTCRYLCANCAWHLRYPPPPNYSRGRLDRINENVLKLYFTILNATIRPLELYKFRHQWPKNSKNWRADIRKVLGSRRRLDMINEDVLKLYFTILNAAIRSLELSKFRHQWPRNSKNRRADIRKVLGSRRRPDRINKGVLKLYFTILNAAIRS